MPRVLDEILDAFYAKLSASDALTEETVQELRALFASGRKLKADDLAAVISKASSEKKQ